MRRVLVLGGDEFIGGQVLLALANSDWARPVTEAANTALARHSNIEGFAFDATDPASL